MKKSRARISEFLSGLNFLIGFFKKLELKTWNTREAKITTEFGSEFRVRIYEPKKNFNNKTILLLHGMNFKGIDDDRLVELALRLSRTGARILTPELDEVKNLLITPKTIENIKELIVHYSKEYPGLGLFAVSFTAGMSLIAVTDDKLKHSLSCIILVGSYSNFKNTISHVVKNFDYDDYGTYILFYNYLERIMPVSKELKETLREAAMDNIFYRKGENSIANQKKLALSVEERKVFESIQLDKEARIAFALKITEESPSLIYEMSPINYCRKLSIKISLIHGRNDRIISEQESEELNSLLEETLPKNFVITPLLSHGDKVDYWKEIPSIPPLAVGFGYFLESIGVGHE
ncbi:MAG: hypothetical protein SFU98_10115 [Leptospiraceae bacterium]|nr:hypothetical protein [Leptospiraceae bacterium]